MLPISSNYRRIPSLRLPRCSAPMAPMRRRVEQALTARPTEDMIAVRVTSSIGDYRAGDEIWCRKVEGDWTSALNRDLLVPRPAGRFIFARLLNIDGEKLHLLPLGAGQPHPDALMAR